MTLEVVHRHKKLVPESGIEFMATVSGAGFWNVCQGPYGVSPVFLGLTGLCFVAFASQWFLLQFYVL